MCAGITQTSSAFCECQVLWVSGRWPASCGLALHKQPASIASIATTGARRQRGEGCCCPKNKTGQWHQRQWPGDNKQQGTRPARFHRPQFQVVQDLLIDKGPLHRGQSPPFASPRSKPQGPVKGSGAWRHLIALQDDVAPPAPRTNFHKNARNYRSLELGNGIYIYNTQQTKSGKAANRGEAM
jgi:hypothetical protein